MKKVLTIILILIVIAIVVASYFKVTNHYTNTNVDSTKSIIEAVDSIEVVADTTAVDSIQ